MFNLPNIYWLANYQSGPPLCEVNQVSGKINNFYSIDKDRLSSFSLIVNGSFISFSIQDGIFYIDGARYPIYYGTTLLTRCNAEKYNDIIQYKQAEAYFNPNSNHGSSGRVVSNNIGYKIKMGDFNLQVIVSIQQNLKKYITVKLVSNKSRNEKLRVGSFEIDAPLTKDIAGEITIEI